MNPEYRTIQRNTSDINDAIANQSNPSLFADKLVGNGFISRAAADNIVPVLGSSDYSKVSRLMSAVDSRIKTSNPTTSFETFIKILRELSLGELADKLVEDYRQRKTGCREPLSSQSVGGLAPSSTSFQQDLILTDDDLPVLQEKLDEVAYQWHRIGIQLGFKPGFLKGIQGDAQNGLQELLTAWLQRETPPSTLQSLVDVIGGHVIKNQVLASKLKKECGDFPSISGKTTTQTPINNQQQHKGKRKASEDDVPDIKEASLEEVRAPRVVEDFSGKKPMCLAYTPEDVRMLVIPSSSNQLSAHIPAPGKLWKTPEIKVYFMNNLPNENWRYENEPITKDKILEWANEWSTFPTPDLPDGNPVPKFVRVGEKTDSDIRVKFTVDGDSRSTVGTDAKQTPHSEATTWLDLGGNDDDYKRHLVLHEFGHVLGLGHEHQSPKALDFIDEKEARKHLSEDYKRILKNMYHGRKLEEMAEEEARKRFQQDYAQRSGGEATKFDPYSIMHYWIPEQWLKEDYKYIASTPESDLQTEEEKEMKKRLSSLATEISELDKKMIAEKYQAMKDSQAAPPEGSQGTKERPDADPASQKTDYGPHTVPCVKNAQPPETGQSNGKETGVKNAQPPETGQSNGRETGVKNAQTSETEQSNGNKTDTKTLEQSAREYTPERLGHFLEEIGLGDHVATFIEQDISGDMLLEATDEATDEMLEELGVKNATEKLKIKVLFQRRLQGGVVQHPLQTVLDFLQENKLDKYCATFQERGMDGDLLLKADDRVLKDLGVKSAVDRIKIKTKYKTFIKK